MKRMNIMLYGATGPFDRGNEALCRAAAGLFRRQAPEARLYLASYGFEEGFPGLNGYFRHRKTAPGIRAFWLRHIVHDHLRWQSLVQREVIAGGTGMDLCISLAGGSYRQGVSDALYAVDRGLFSQGARLELWGLHSGPEAFRGLMKRDLNLFSRIIASNDDTYHALLSQGFSETAVRLPHPAFLLAPQPATLPETFRNGGFVCVSVGPQGLDWMQALLELTDYLLRATYFSLVPVDFVAAHGRGDGAVRGELARHYKKSPLRGRILSAPQGLNAAQMVWFYKKARLVVTTHPLAAVCALAVGTPALLIGESQYAHGVLRDALGPLANECLYTQKPPEGPGLIQAFRRLLYREDALRVALTENIPALQDRLEKELILLP